jgi:hypothetical protein
MDERKHCDSMGSLQRKVKTSSVCMSGPSCTMTGYNKHTVLVQVRDPDPI